MNRKDTEHGLETEYRAPVLACLDAHYTGQRGIAACVLFARWDDAEPLREIVSRVESRSPYIPGRLYERELPCLLEVLEFVERPLGTAIVDGYVWLYDDRTPGLGGHLYRKMERQVPVIGVAKNPLKIAGPHIEVLRGTGSRPLYVSAAGVALETAAQRIRAMAGPFRIPSLIKRADRLSRGERCER